MITNCLRCDKECDVEPVPEGYHVPDSWDALVEEMKKPLTRKLCIQACEDCQIVIRQSLSSKQ